MTEADAPIFSVALVIDPLESTRKLFAAALKEQHVKTVLMASTVKEGWSLLEAGSDTPGLILTTIDSREPINAFHLLNLALENSDFSGCRISFLTTDEDSPFLTPAFEMGLLSFHAKASTQLEINAELGEMFAKLAEGPEKNCLVAGAFLRRHLNETDNFEQLINLEESLVDRFPDDGELQLNLAEAHYLAGDPKKARQLIWRARHMGEKYKLGVQQLEELIDNEVGKDDSISTVFDVQSCLIVEPDEAFATHIQDSLSSLGVKDIHLFNDGGEALEWLKKDGRPDVVVQEWKLPGVSGAAFFQALKRQGQKFTPVIILSSLLTDQDRMLVRELGASAVLEKPVSKEYLIGVIIKTLSQIGDPTSYKSIELEFQKALEAHDLDKAKKCLEKYKKSPHPPQTSKLLREAEYSYHAREFGIAKNLALQAYKGHGEILQILNLLGKVFIKLDDMDSAVKCFDKAQQMSPKNLERLCLIAESKAIMGEQDQAEAAIAEAKKISPDDQKVAEIEVGLCLEKGDVSKASALMAGFESLSNLAAYMNNRAVTMVKGGDLSAAMDLYKSLLDSLPDAKRKERQSILYNLGLALAKSDDLDAAIDVLQQVEQGVDENVFKKAKALSARIMAAIERGSELRLNTAAATTAKSASVTGSLKPLSLYAQPGQICLHLLYDSNIPLDDKVGKLLERKVKYNRREQQTIERDAIVRGSA